MYLLMYVIGFILVIGGIWLLLKGETVEGMADTSTVVMAAIGGNNTYFADIGLTNQPNWSITGGEYKQISGSMGRLIGVNNANIAYYGTKFDIVGSAFKWLAIPGATTRVTQVSFDYPMVVGLTESKTIVYIKNVPSNPQTAVWEKVAGSDENKTFNYITMNNGAAVGAGTDNKIWYCRDVRSPVWRDISTGLLTGRSIRNMAFDGNDVAVVDTNNTVYFANNMNEINDMYRSSGQTGGGYIMPNWKTLDSKRMKQISIRNHMAVGLGEDNRIYFAASIKDGNWAAVNGPSSPTWVELYYHAGANVISFRPASMNLKGGASPCPSGYTLNGSMCYSNCPAGYTDNGATCAYTTTVAGAIVAVNKVSGAGPNASCKPGYTPVPTGTSRCVSQTNGSIGTMNNGICPNSYSKVENIVCMSTCPSGNTETVTDCIPPKIPKPSTPAVTDNYSCSTGFLNATNTCSDPCPVGYKLEESRNAGGKLVYGTRCIQEVPEPPYIPNIIPYNTALADTSYTKLPTKGDDQAITRPAKVRYVRIRPPITGGDGIINLSQIIVLDKNGNNIARNKSVTASSTNSAYDPPAVLVDGSTVIRKPTSAKFFLRYGTAILAPLTWKTIGVNRNYPTANNIGSPVPVTRLSDAQAKCIAAAGCSGFSITSGPSPTAQFMDITESTDSTGFVPIYNYSNALFATRNFQSKGQNLTYPAANNIGSPVPVTGLADAQAKCLATPGATGFSITSGRSPTAQFLNIVDSTPSTSFTPKMIYTARSDSTADPVWITTNNAQHPWGDIDYASVSIEEAKAGCLARLSCNEFAYTGGVAYFKEIADGGGMVAYPWAPLTTYRLSDRIIQAGVSNANTVYMLTDPNWIVRNNAHYSWGTISTASSLTVEEAKIQCRNTEGCIGFTFWGHSDTKGYIEFKNVPATQDLTGYWWSPVTTYRLADSILTQGTPVLTNTIYTSSDPNWDITHNSQHYAQGDIGTFVGNVKDAKVKCVNTPGCTEFVYAGGTAYLKNMLSIDGVWDPTWFPRSSGVTTYALTDSIKQGIISSSVSVDNGVWASATNDRSKEFIEVDLGSEQEISGVRLIGRRDYNFTTDRVDRMTGVRIMIQEALSILTNGCPNGYTSRANNTVCVENCPTGFVYSGNEATSSHSCLFPELGTPTTTRSATYIPPCPSDTTRVENLCYSRCPAGTTDVGSNTCQPAISKRTQGLAPTLAVSNLCTPPLVYVQSINACSPVCPVGTTPMYSENKTICTNPNTQMQRTITPAVASYTCNSNEILENGVCMSKCPDGSAPDGDICVPQMKLVEADEKVKCISSPYNNSKKWMCESSEDLNTLITNPTDTTTYITPTDKICVTENQTTKMYFCITGAEAMKGLDPLNTLKQDFTKTCQIITKSYTDLSNNLTNLVKIRNGMQGGSTQLGSAKDNLNSIYNQMNCAGATEKKLDLCNKIKTAANTLGTNSSEVLAKLNTIIPMLKDALDTRDELVGYKSNFHCPKM
jgi:hypothetical protein